MAYIYPKTIQTTTGHSIKHATQNITNPSNLCSGNTKLAYWGVKTPTYMGSYMRNWPDSVTTISGSYYKPETIYATDWNVGNIPNNAIVKKIKIEYKWEQISYSCGTSDCYGRFDKPTITLISHSKKLTSFSGARPEAIRYHNNKTNPAKMNTNNAELKTLHSHSINMSPYKMTIKDLKKMKIKFDPAKNTYSEYCRIVMQFIRIKIEYEEQEVVVLPTFRVSSTITPKKTNTGEEWIYTCKIRTTNSVTKPTTCHISLNDSKTQLKSIEQSVSGNEFKNGVWTINKFSKGEAKITLKCATPLPKTVTVTSTIQKYADSVNKTAKSSITIVEPVINVSWEMKVVGDQPPYIYADPAGDGIRKCLQLYLTRSKIASGNENFIIDTNNWLTEDKYDLVITEYDGSDQNSSIPLEKGQWKIDNIKGTTLKAEFREKNTNNCPIIKAGDHKIVIKHHEDGKNDTEQTMNIIMTGPAMDKEFFKLRIEDGTDIRYNSLMFTSGDDLTTPVTYDITDENEEKFKQIKIIGETIKIPTNEAHYTTYTINIDEESKIDLENILSHLEIYNENGENCSDVIIGVDNQMQLYEGDENKYCVIDSLKSPIQKKLKFIVQSDIEQICYFKLKPFNYDNYESGEWIMSKIIFQDIPNIKLSISSDNTDLNTDNNKETTIQYCIENKSSISGGHDHYKGSDSYDDALKFKIKEPSSFKIKTLVINDKKYNLPSENVHDKNAPFFNERTRILTIPYLPAQHMNETTEELESIKYCLCITYEATQKGIFDFTIDTYDEQLNIYDNQYKNSATQKVLVDVDNNVKIKTKVSNKRPYINELIDFTVNVKNFTKEQKKFTFVIKDVGTYGIDHNKCDYEIVYVNCENGTFTESSKDNSLGTWILKDIGINDEYELVLTLKPKDIGYHTIQTIFNEDSQEFENIVNVLERNKQIDFNVYHAVDPTKNENCANFDDLIEICDDDYITLEEDLYYVLDITNNNRNDIETTTHIYARLPQSFLQNDVILCNDKYNLIIDNNNLIKIDIPQIKRCENIKIYFKVTPSEMGLYKSTFMLTNRNAKIYHKQLNINVDTQLDSKKLEHEINIYNFEKTNQYFRYELDSENNIFKFFNQGDKSLKMIDAENYNKSSIETYRGTNLKDIVRQIKNNSKYVEPEFLRTGSNKLAAKGYELYPDGFMRRFGLLNSDVFHETGQLPTISLLSDRAMHWDIDLWETKVWGGGIYDNGVFDVSIDYDKIPKNFDILDIDNPATKLQGIVDRTKPYGTQALCHYSNTIYLNMGMNLNIKDTEINNDITFPMNLNKYYITKNKEKKLANDFGLISTYHRYDNSIAHYFDMFRYSIQPDIDLDYTTMCRDEEEPVKISTDLDLTTDIFTTNLNKAYITDCLDIVENLYSYNSNIQNIDIIKIMEYNGVKNRSTNFKITKDDIYNIYTFEITNKEDIKIIHDNDIYYIKYVNDTINNFKGFTISKDEKILFKRNAIINADSYKVQIQQYQKEYSNNSYKTIMHIWISTDTNIYYHLGYFIFNDTHDNTINVTYNTFSRTNKDEKINFQISNEEKQIIETTDNVVQFDNKYQWSYLNNINNKNKYAIFENNIDIDPDCKDSYISVPPLALKYNNIHLANTDEIIDIALQIKANSNKINFAQDIKVNMCKNGDYYIPYNNLSSKIYYPSSIGNVSEDFSTNIKIQQPNITICSKCMKTSLGLFDYCPHCGSVLVTHYDEKKQVTICDNCSWITDGWYDYCPHCLSESITKTLVDFNKTYCYDCQRISNDYYPRCPKCLSENVLHMTNDEKTYDVGNKNNQNIDITTIKTYTNRVNICNIEVPLNLNTDSIKYLEYLYLHIHGNNYNDGKFYYCPECNTANLGHTDKCPNCKSTNIINHTFDNTITDVYCSANGKQYKIGTYKLEKEFVLSFDLIELSTDNYNDTLTLSFYVENLAQDNSVTTINNLNIDDSSFSIIQDNIPLINVDFDNIYYDYKYVNEKEWLGLDNLQHSNHTYLKYANKYDIETPKINLYDFNIPNGKFEELSFTLCGFNKSDAHINAELIITNKNNEVYNATIENIGPHNFQETIDLSNIVDTTILEDLSIQLFFTNLIHRTDVYISDCFITVNKNKYKNDIIIKNNKHIIEQDKNQFLIKSTDNNLWGINKEEPYYLAGRHLNPGIVCFIDFGRINATEYIRLYDAKLIITYKTTYGRIITESIPITYEEHNKCLINGNIQQNNAETWGSIKTPYCILNNLESQILNNDDDKRLSSIPIINGIAQAFTSPTSNISQIWLNYDGRIGYPNESIILEIYDDDYNQPSNILLSKEILLPLTKGKIDIDVDLDNLDIGDQYWIVLKDNTADENNYHHFKYNGELSVGNLIYLDNNNRDSNIVLCFGINTNLDLKLYYNLPTSWDFDVTNSDINSNYKLYQTFYRYNSNNNSNVHINDLSFETGYTITDDMEEIIINDESDDEYNEEYYNIEDESFYGEKIMELDMTTKITQILEITKKINGNNIKEKKVEKNNQWTTEEYQIEEGNQWRTISEDEYNNIIRGE